MRCSDVQRDRNWFFHCSSDVVCAEQETSALQERLRDPVVAADGHTYERAAIESWLQNCQSAEQLVPPVTGASLPLAGLLPNRNISTCLTASDTVSPAYAELSFQPRSRGFVTACHHCHDNDARFLAIAGHSVSLQPDAGVPTVCSSSVTKQTSRSKREPPNRRLMIIMLAAAYSGPSAGPYEPLLHHASTACTATRAGVKTHTRAVL